MSVVKKGDLVEIHFTSRRQVDGSVIESSRAGEPLKFIAGSSEVIEAVSSTVLGMKLGEPRTVTVTPKAGFGTRKPGLEQRVPRRAVPETRED